MSSQALPPNEANIEFISMEGSTHTAFSGKACLPVGLLVYGSVSAVLGSIMQFIYLFKPQLAGASLRNVECSPYHIDDKAVIMGDAAHAMVPFYGQGMNCGFEDCIVLDDLLSKHKDDLGAALSEFTTNRSVDAKAMCDLAFYNYVEMRKSVNSKIFLLRKKIDNFLFWLFPKTWVPLYTMVSFSRTRYHECIKRREWQDRVLTRCLCVGGVVAAVGGVVLGRQLVRQNTVVQDKLQQLTDRFSSWWK